MTQHLISLSLGPVQDFIAQARRSRDLWFGSHLLSEISRAAAKAIAEAGGELIFPALQKDDAELEPCDGMQRDKSQGAAPLAVANKLLAAANSFDAAQQCVLAARSAAVKRWQQLAEQARCQTQDLLAWPEVEPIWNEQVQGVIEFYAAAAPMTAESLGDVRDLLERELAARKNVRPFQPFQHHRHGAPKSTFDGSRVSVLRDSRKGEAVRQRFRIPQSESLDAIGVVKRTGGKPEQFVPIANVALAPWIAAAKRDTATAELIDQLQRLMLDGPFADVFGRVVRSDIPAGAVFRTDAQVFLSDRLESLLIECEAAKSRDDLRRSQDYDCLSRVIQSIMCKVVKPPHPYVATIVVDGDRMGAALRKLTDIKTLRKFSEGLSQFANIAKQIVEQQCMGSLLYAGGDDVVGFIPLETAVQCAEGLRQAFADLMTPGMALPGDWPANDPDFPIPTLSVGVSVGHVLSGMGTLLEGGRIAERLAKGSNLATDRQRNAIAIRVDKRSGGELSWRAQWADELTIGCPIQRLRDAMQRVGRNDQLSVLPATKLAEVRRDLRRFPAANLPTDDQAHWAKILRLDFLRTIGRAARGFQVTDSQRDLADGNPHSIEESFGITLSSTNYATCFESIEDWIALHLIAKELVRGQVVEARQSELELQRGEV